MAQRALLVCLAWLVYSQTPALAQEGRLDAIRNDVHGDNSSSASQPRRDSSNSEESDGFVSDLIGGLISGLFNGHSSASSDSSPPSRDGFGHFVAYPYCSDYPGYRVPRIGYWPEFLKPWDGGVEPLRWSARLSGEDGNDFTGLNRAQGQFLLETSSCWGFLTSWNHFHERLGAGRSDEMTLGDANVILSGGLSGDCVVRIGLGVRTLIDRGRTDWGFNFHIGGDVFPVRPLIFSWSADFGTVGDAGVAHGRATLGVMQNRWEIFGGYDAMLIGGTTLHGPLIGVRLWF